MTFGGNFRLFTRLSIFDSEVMKSVAFQLAKLAQPAQRAQLIDGSTLNIESEKNRS